MGYDVVAPREHGSFAASGSRVLPAGRGYFPKGGTVHAFAQLVGGDAGATVRIGLSGPAGILRHDDVASDGRVVAHAIELGDVDAGSYSVVFDLLGPGGDIVATKSSAFDVVDVEGLPRPALVYRNVVAEPETASSALEIAGQYIARGDLAAAERTLRSAVGDIDAVEDGERGGADAVRWTLATVLLYSARGAEALELLRPLETSYPDRPEVVEGLGFAFYVLQDYEMALPRLEHAMALRPPDIAVLNATGDCYQKLGRTDKAREMFELSLSVNPNQDGVRARLVELEP